MMKYLTHLRKKILSIPKPVLSGMAIFGLCIVVALSKGKGQSVHQYHQLRDPSLSGAAGGQQDGVSSLLDAISDGAMQIFQLFFGSLWEWLAPPNFGFVIIIPVMLALKLISHSRDQAAGLAGAPHDGTGSRHLDHLVETAGPVGLEAVPRALLNNPYSSEFAGLCLQDRVAIAVEASGRAGRRVGAIVLRVGGEAASNFEQYDVPQDNPGQNGHLDLAASRQEPIRAIETALQNSVRQSDYVGVVDGNSLVVFISLLNTKSDLLSVANRLHKAAGKALRAAGCPAEALSKPGAAMYPLDGYNADDLLDTARWRAQYEICGNAQPALTAVKPPKSPQGLQYFGAVVN